MNICTKQVKMLLMGKNLGGSSKTVSRDIYQINSKS